MKKIILFIAMSLDGYIAKSNGNVDWLSGHDANADSMQSYRTFIKEIDTIVMGWNTYHQIATELTPDEWAYGGMTSYIVTHRNRPSTEEIKFVNMDTCELVASLRQGEGKDIWICGGAKVIRPLINKNMIDRYHISVIPTLLGSGIRLFETVDSEMQLSLIGTQSYNGITDLIYERR